MSRVLVTGGSGFIGSALAARLEADGYDVTLLLRRPVRADSSIESVVVAELNGELLNILNGVDTVIHAAAMVSSELKGRAALAAYRAVNVEGTVSLARQAATAGVRRFIFMSSIKVNGESTCGREPFRSSDTAAPEDAYAQSKLEAERALLELAQESGLQVVIIRPPLVYGPGAKGNFARLLRLLGKGYPLPLGGIENKRSMIGLDNLMDLTVHCINHPAAAGQVLLASDGEDLSSSELLRRLAICTGAPGRLIQVPRVVWRLIEKMFGWHPAAGRLLGSLQVDSQATCELLGWQPPVSVNESLRRCVRKQGSGY